MTSEKLKAEKKAKMDALIKLAEENIKNNPVLRVMRDDYIPQNERVSDEDKEIQRLIAVKKLEDAAENIKRKRVERAAAREASLKRLRLQELTPEQVAYAKEHPLVLDNWEIEKGKINAAKNIGMGIMKKEMSDMIIENNKDIKKKYNKEVWDAIISNINMGFAPGDIYPLNMIEIIKELKPEKKYLSNHKLRHYIPSRFFNLADMDQLKKYYHPKNLYIKKDEED